MTGGRWGRRSCRWRGKPAATNAKTADMVNASAWFGGQVPTARQFDFPGDCVAGRAGRRTLKPLPQRDQPPAARRASPPAPAAVARQGVRIGTICRLQSILGRPNGTNGIFGLKNNEIYKLCIISVLQKFKDSRNRRNRQLCVIPAHRVKITRPPAPRPARDT